MKIVIFNLMMFGLQEKNRAIDNQPITLSIGGEITEQNVNESEGHTTGNIKEVQPAVSDNSYSTKTISSETLGESSGDASNSDTISSEMGFVAAGTIKDTAGETEGEAYVSESCCNDKSSIGSENEQDVRETAPPQVCESFFKK